MRKISSVPVRIGMQGISIKLKHINKAVKPMLGFLDTFLMFTYFSALCANFLLFTSKKATWH